ncbi:MAG: hypothetical protein HY540_01955 [Deltaproteobacteria bacterium]|nr:hypothetical protein [Deltaproteobacteria bacterium]
MIHLTSTNSPAAQVAFAAQVTAGLIGHVGFLNRIAANSSLNHMTTAVDALRQNPRTIFETFTVYNHFSGSSVVKIFHETIVNPFPPGPIGAFVAGSDLEPAYRYAIERNDLSSFESYAGTVADAMIKSAAVIDGVFDKLKRDETLTDGDHAVISLLGYVRPHCLDLHGETSSWLKAPMGNMKYRDLTRLLSFMPPPPLTEESTWMEAFDFLDQRRGSDPPARLHRIRQMSTSLLRFPWNRQRALEQRKKKEILSHVRENNYTASVQGLRELRAELDQQGRLQEAAFFGYQRGILEFAHAFKQDKEGNLETAIQLYFDATLSLGEFGFNLNAAKAQVGLHDALIKLAKEANTEEKKKVAEQKIRTYLPRLHVDLRDDDLTATLSIFTPLEKQEAPMTWGLFGILPTPKG